MNRIEEKLEKLKADGKKAFITYTTAGLPNMETTEKIMFAQEEAGIDIMELGVPFSDPIADGPVIQGASYEAILNGATLEKTFTLMKTVRDKGLKTPVVYMMYYNTVFHYGLDAFVEKCVECGVDGLIIPDLPKEEQGELKSVLDKKENSPILIQLISPVSKQRIPELVDGARGFVYCVSQMGVTGGQADFHKNIREYLSSVKAASKVPVMMGFGIRTAADVKPLEDVIDGAIVGSHFIKLLKENNYDTEAVKEYITKFKSEM
jgi:tryptophan synthase alpha chain